MPAEVTHHGSPSHQKRVMDLDSGLSQFTRGITQEAKEDLHNLFSNDKLVSRDKL